MVYPTTNQIDGTRVPGQNKAKSGQTKVKPSQKPTGFKKVPGKVPKTSNYVVPVGNWSCDGIQWSKRFVMPFFQFSF